MGAKKTSDPVTAKDRGAQDAHAQSEGKASKKRVASSRKLHVEIARGNWKRLAAFIEAYNRDPGRVTPKIKPAHVINDALARYLVVDKKEP